MTPLMKTVKSLFSDRELRESYLAGKDMRITGLTSEEKRALTLSRPAAVTSTGKVMETTLAPWL